MPVWSKTLKSSGLTHRRYGFEPRRAHEGRQHCGGQMSFSEQLSALLSASGAQQMDIAVSERLAFGDYRVSPLRTCAKSTGERDLFALNETLVRSTEFEAIRRIG